MTERCEGFEHLHSAWVDGELRKGERARLAAHLQRCARCRSAIDELRVTQAMLRSLPVRNLVVDVDRVPGELPRRRAISAAAVLSVVARSAVATVLATATLGAAAFVAGAQDPPDRQVAVPVDVFVADHLVRAVGGPVSTPALRNTQP